MCKRRPGLYDAFTSMNLLVLSAMCPFLSLTDERMEIQSPHGLSIIPQLLRGGTGSGPQIC